MNGQKSVSLFLKLIRVRFRKTEPATSTVSVERLSYWTADFYSYVTLPAIYVIVNIYLSDPIIYPK